MTKKQVILIVLDGWGYREETEHNAIAEAETPYFDYLWSKYPHTTLAASGGAVGLPEDQMGNSEVGHMVIGAGKVLDTDLVKINNALEKNIFGEMLAFQALFDHVKKYDSVLHIEGLVSPGGVHSHSQHLYEFLKVAKKAGITKVAIHAFTDGRDMPPRSAHLHLKELEDVIEKVGIGFIATTSGRFYAMDRDNNWDRLKKVEDAIIGGIGKKIQNKKPSEIISELYQKDIFDQYIEPMVFLDDQGKSFQINQNDGVFLFNFRKDRSRMISQKMLEQKKLKNLCFVTMTKYDKNFDCLVAFDSEIAETTIAREISSAGLSQAHIAETEKFAHATYYLNGGKQDPYPGEKDILIESRKDVKTHDLAPEMKAKEIADATIAQIEAGTNFIFVNFANPDMVGHTENTAAIKTAVEVVDKELKRVINSAIKNSVEAIVSADHGNAELTFDKNCGQKHTAHTTNPVPMILITSKKVTLKTGGLKDIAPTILNLLGLSKPDVMTGQSLILKK